MSKLPPHQQRVLDEREELDARINKLRDFINEQFSAFTRVDYNEQSRLRTQLAIMEAYLTILDERINHF